MRDDIAAFRKTFLTFALITVKKNEPLETEVKFDMQM